MHGDVLAALLLVWAGLVGGVSFLATPAKFRSRQLSRAVALDVGRCTFAVLGRVELGFAVAVAAAAALSPLPSLGLRLAVQAPAVILLAQLLWIRPGSTAARGASSTETILRRRRCMSPSSAARR